MSNKQLGRLAVMVLAALGLWGVFAFTRRERTDRVASFALPKVDTSAVDTMAFITGADSAIVVRDSGGAWRVNGYPAATSSVQGMLRSLVDTSNWTELAARSRGSEAAMGVSAHSGRRVRVVTKQGVALSLVAGNNTSGYAGVFVRAPADSAVYALHGPLSQVLNRAVSDWRDKTITSMPPDSVQRVDVLHGKRSYALVRSGRGWKVEGGPAADSQTVNQLLDRFHPLTAMSFAKPAQLDSLHFTRPWGRVRLFGAGPKPLVELLLDSTSTDGWVRADTGTTVYEIESWQMGQLVPAESTFTKRMVKAR